MSTTITSAVLEWHTKTRRMGCVAAANWLCKRVDGFYPLRKRFYLPHGSDKNGRFWEHVVATNGIIEIDLAPYANKPKIS